MSIPAVAAKAFALITTTLLLTACQSATTPTKTGFLTDYQGFKDHPDVEEAQIWLPAGSSMSSVSRYQKFMLTPIEVWYDPQADYKGVSPNEMKAITDYFEQAIRREVGSKYPIVTEPGPDVAVVRMAITGVQRAAPERSALGYIPIALLVSAGKSAADAAAGEEVTVITASLEAEMYDSVRGNRVFALIDEQVGEKTTHAKGARSFQQIQTVLDGWAKRFRHNLDKYNAL